MHINKKKIYTIIRYILRVIVILCILYIAIVSIQSYLNKAEARKLADERKQIEMRIAEEQEKQAEIIKQEKAIKQEVKQAEEDAVSEEPAILEQYKALYNRNNDMVGWLAIEDMDIDYPVMQNEDNEFYLHHNFEKEEDRYGALYIKSNIDINEPDSGFVIYGHNMKDGSMFGDLDLYRDKNFYKEHRRIYFDTLYERRTYEIVSVFLSQVYNEDEETFKYYQYPQTETKEEFDEFYHNIKELSVYDTDVTAEYGDNFLMLSTCAYHVEDGRLVIAAKQIQSDTSADIVDKKQCRK